VVDCRRVSEHSLSSSTWACSNTDIEPFYLTKDESNPVHLSTEHLSSNCTLEHRNQFLAKINNRGKACNEVDQMVRREVRVVTEDAATSMGKRGRKRKSAGTENNTATSKAKAVQTGEGQDMAETEQAVSAPKPTAKVGKMSNGLALSFFKETLAEDGTVLDSWRAPVARMWSYV
jgi:hypothetical protein